MNLSSRSLIKLNLLPQSMFYVLISQRPVSETYTDTFQMELLFALTRSDNGLQSCYEEKDNKRTWNKLHHLQNDIKLVSFSVYYFVNVPFDSVHQAELSIWQIMLTFCIVSQLTMWLLLIVTMYRYNKRTMKQTLTEDRTCLVDRIFKVENTILNRVWQVKLGDIHWQQTDST